MLRYVLIVILWCNLLHSDNRLSKASSPYLQQHRHNPVDWYPWSEEAFAKAKKEHKPIFLSIGYSTCHWCHEMARESFENEAIAALLNKDYVAIKVDREELSHIDSYYQGLYRQNYGRSVGWPMSLILTEEAQAFFLAGYLPANQAYGVEGLQTLLPRIAKAYKENPLSFKHKALLLTKERSSQHQIVVDKNNSIATIVYNQIADEFDELYFGFSTQPKFPQAAKLKLLLTLDELGVGKSREMVLQTLEAMALGGIYDQSEGGFFRYSVDAAWEIPHFEKMLYTNAELIPLYVKAYQLTQDSLYRDIVIESIDNMQEYFGSKGLYFSASNAETEGEEGKYFTYTKAELENLLREMPEAKGISTAIELSSAGNFELEEEVKFHLNLYTKKRPKGFKAFQDALKRVRQKRPYPFIDTKVNTAWNAMMISALFQASLIDEKYKQMAEKSMMALLGKMYVKGVLYHHQVEGFALEQEALLEDYAFVISALLNAYDVNLKEAYLVMADQLAQQSMAKFLRDGEWYLSQDGFAIKTDMIDKYYTAPLHELLLSYLKLSVLLGNRSYEKYVNDYLHSKQMILRSKPKDHPSAVGLQLAYTHGYKVLKSTKDSLGREFGRLSNIRYPFLLKREDTKVKGFVVCDNTRCYGQFSTLEKSDELMKEINP